MGQDNALGGSVSSVGSRASAIQNASIPITVTITPTSTINVTVTPTSTVFVTIQPNLSMSITQVTMSSTGGLTLTILNNGNTVISNFLVTVTPALGSDTYVCIPTGPGPLQSSSCVSYGATFPTAGTTYDVRVTATNVLGNAVADVTIVAGT